MVTNQPVPTRQPPHNTKCTQEGTKSKGHTLLSFACHFPSEKERTRGQIVGFTYVRSRNSNHSGRTYKNRFYTSTYDQTGPYFLSRLAGTINQRVHQTYNVKTTKTLVRCWYDGDRNYSSSGTTGCVKQKKKRQQSSTRCTKLTADVLETLLYN